MLKNGCKKSVFLYSLLYNLLLIKLLFFDGSALGVAAITAQQRQEVESLKSELNKALENPNDDAPAKGVVIQPTWTQEAKSDPKEIAKVKVTAENRKEAAELRAEIEHAVAHDYYANVGAAKTEDIKNLELTLAAKDEGKKALGNIMGSPLESTETEFVGAKVDHQKKHHWKFQMPNIIAANVADDSDIDIRKLERLQLSKKRNREVLILKYIEEDFSFDFGPYVLEWQHIVHGGQEYFIGRRLTDLLMVHKDTVNYGKPMVVEVGHLISATESYTFWNVDQQQQEGVILISTGDKVLWYRANNATKQIELYWNWVMGNTITGLTYFTLDSNDYLIVSTNHSSLAGYHALNIYQYNLEAKEFWIAQRLQLKKPCDKITVLNTGRDVILAIAQHNTADIYTFNPHEADFSNIHFQLKRSITAGGISTIAGFKMGGRNYLALSGYQPQILVYQQGEFMAKTILGDNFGLVELFFPVPVRTYRDDLILLVQHRVNFISHSLNVLQTLMWNGDAFETSIPVPCYMGSQQVYGASCMLDWKRDEGLAGAALLKRGDEISVIVPRHEAESGLFRFHTELLPKNSELLELQEIFDFIKDWVKEQDDLVAQAESFLQLDEEELLQVAPDLSEMEYLSTPKFTLNGEADEIYVNDYKWSEKDDDIGLQFLIKSVEDLEHYLNSGRQKRNLDELLQENLDFDEVLVEELEVENVNGEKYFIQNGNLNFEGLIEFNELEVLKKLNSLRKRQVIEDSFVLENNLEFDMINGVEWSVLTDNMVFKNEKLMLEELEVEGEVSCENILTVKTLNTLNFPDDYVLSNGPTLSIVTAEKHFINSLSASAVDTNGLINGKNPTDAITLEDDQQWQGMPTFKHLEVADILELQGQVQVPQIPTLEESNVIEATCHFNELIVNGNVLLEGEMDEKPLALHFNDILLKPQDYLEEILVPSSKVFDTVVFPKDFQLENNTINQIPVTDFVTLHTAQTLNINSLDGNVSFHNLTLSGSFDGVKVEELVKEVIFVDKLIDLSDTELIFPEKLIVKKTVRIVNTLNQQTIKDNLQTLKENLKLETVEFENLIAEKAVFFNDIFGSGKLTNTEMHDIATNESAHEFSVKGNIVINEMILGKGLEADMLYGIKAKYLLNFLSKIRNLPQMVLAGQIEVDNITVIGDVKLHKINGLLFDEDIQLTTVKLNRPNFLCTDLKFRNKLNMKGQLNIMADFRGDYVPNLIDDIIIRSPNSSIEIEATKIFQAPVKVSHNTQVEAINGKLLENMAWKSKDNIFKGSLQLKGNLVAHEINIQGSINNFKTQDLDDLMYFDNKLNNFVLKNAVEFKTPITLDNLSVMGDLNDVANISDFFENLIHKNHLCLLKGKNTFTGRVSIDKGAYINKLNGYDLTYLFNNLVFIHGHQPVVIQAPVTFENHIQANELQIKKTLKVEHLNSWSLKEWLSNTLRVDQDQNIPHYLHFEEGSLDGKSLLVDFIRDIDMSRVVTLNTPQLFNESVRMSDVILTGAITSEGLVNNRNLEQEFNNTLMTYGHQHITKPLLVNSIVVLGDLTVHSVVNENKNLQDVATFQEDLILESPVTFQSLYTPHVIMQDVTSGIDFNKWFKSAVQNLESKTQYITGNWSAKFLVVRTGAKKFDYVINGLSPGEYYPHIRYLRSSKEKLEEEICFLIQEIKKEVDHKAIYLKYIEEIYNMDLSTHFQHLPNDTLMKMFHLKVPEQRDFLLINKKCQSLMYKWSPKESRFMFKSSFESGPIQEIEIITPLEDATKFVFITTIDNSESIKCSLPASRKWKILNDSIEMENNVPISNNLLYTHNNDPLWVVDKRNIKQMDLHTNETKQKWQLPQERNNTRYRFARYNDREEILLTNGEHFDKNTKKSASEPEFLETSFLLEHRGPDNSETLLKPNSTLTKYLAFANFKQILQHILVGLIQRLEQQVYLIQLSIPESDLFDEHLVVDFAEVIQQLRKQIIFPHEELNITFDNLDLPGNPAQVLAAHAVQIVWPVVVEIEELHSYLKSNETHDEHTFYAAISKTLALLIKDVLEVAFPVNKTNVGNDYSEELIKVIERLRLFEKDLETFVMALEKQEEQQPQIKHLEEENDLPTSTNREIQTFAEHHDDLMFGDDPSLPGLEQGEILSLDVGHSSNPLNLWAVTNTKTPLIAYNNPGIYLYLQGLKGQIYQIIAAIEPRSLQQLRIQHTTLLLFIENCCQVNILSYQGSQGFTKFAEINIKENIQQILTVALPTKSGPPKYLLILSLQNKVKFYEFIIEGLNVDKDITKLIPKSLNCNRIPHEY